MYCIFIWDDEILFVVDFYFGVDTYWIDLGFGDGILESGMGFGYCGWVLCDIILRRFDFG